MPHSRESPQAQVTHAQPQAGSHAQAWNAATQEMLLCLLVSLLLLQGQWQLWWQVCVLVGLLLLLLLLLQAVLA